MLDKSIISFSAIPVIGIASQWLAWQLRIPSILILLMTGFLAGPIFGVIHPDQLLGEALFPIISLSVAIILFEGGLGLKISDLKNTGKVVRNLITIGSFITWIMVTVTATLILGLNIKVSVLFGAILVVTGPTVIIPLLKQIRVKRQVSSILRWEGIMIDPVGATLAVLIFEILLAGGSQAAVGLALMVIISTLFLGALLGCVGAFTLMVIIKRHWVPDSLQEAVTLMTVVGMYTCADMIQKESGLLVVTVMGIVLANQKTVIIKHIVTFKEQLTVLLLSSLFVVLAARMELQELIQYLNWHTGLFLLVLVIIIRPLAVFFSTLGSNLKKKEKIFLSGIAPRGIVAAAVASLFALRLSDAGIFQANELVPLTFIVIVFTVIFYSVVGNILARVLDLKPQEKGLVMLGSHELARSMAKKLQEIGVPVLLVDNKKENILEARQEGLRAIHGSIFSQKIKEEIEMSSMGRLVALTSSDETNLLAVMEYTELLGRNNVFRLFTSDRKKDLVTQGNAGLFLFGKGITYTYLKSKQTAGAIIQSIKLTEKYSFETFKKNYPNAIPLYLINRRKKLVVISEENPLKASFGQTLVFIAT